MRPRTRPPGALLCTIANTAVGLVGSGCGCLMALGGGLAALDRGGPPEVAAVALVLMGLYAVGQLLLLTGGIFCIVGLAARRGALRRGLLLGAVGSALAVPASLLGVLGAGMALFGAARPQAPRGAPTVLLNAVMVGTGLFCLLPLLTGAANLRAWLHARREPPEIDLTAATSAFD